MPAPAAPTPQFTPEQILEVYGWALGDGKAEQLGLTPAEAEAVARGFATSIKGQPPPAIFDQAVPFAQQFLNDRARKVQEGIGEKNKAEEVEFLAKMDANPAVKKTASGLRYEIVNPGADPRPTAADTVVAHYTLMFADGTVVESSKTGGGEPAEFSLGGVIKAWTEGLQLIGTGGQIKLYVPSAIGYGERGSPGGIPPAKVLVFDVELVAVKPAPVQLPGVPGAPGGVNLSP
jgi:FKBP-type peptidyl-prolyl cis-trans isomerase